MQRRVLYLSRISATTIANCRLDVQYIGKLENQLLELKTFQHLSGVAPRASLSDFISADAAVLHVTKRYP